MASLFQWIYRRYLSLATRVGWLAQRALSYELNTTIAILRMDYYTPERQGSGSAEQLQADLCFARSCSTRQSARYGSCNSHWHVISPSHSLSYAPRVSALSKRPNKTYSNRIPGPSVIALSPLFLLSIGLLPLHRLTGYSAIAASPKSAGSTAHSQPP